MMPKMTCYGHIWSTNACIPVLLQNTPKTCRIPTTRWNQITGINDIITTTNRTMKYTKHSVVDTPKRRLLPTTNTGTVTTHIIRVSQTTTQLVRTETRQMLATRVLLVATTRISYTGTLQRPCIHAFRRI